MLASINWHTIAVLCVNRIDEHVVWREGLDIVSSMTYLQPMQERDFQSFSRKFCLQNVLSCAFAQNNFLESLRHSEP
jgi:hypothetical protein